MLKALLILSAVLAIYASSHSEAPGTAKIPNADITDFYMFMSYEAGRDGFVTFLMNVQPLQNPFGGPNYFSLSDDHFYELNLDINGDITEDVVFSFYFGFGYPGPGTATYRTYIPITCENINYGYINSTVPAAVALNIYNGIMVPIALKVFGPVNSTQANPTTGTVAGSLNWVEWYYLTQSMGGNNYTIANPLSGGTKFYKPFDYAGEKSFGNSASYAAYASKYIYNITVKNATDSTDCATQGRVFVGQRAEAFNINLGKIFDLINFVPVPGIAGASIAQCDSNNDLRDKNVDVLALEIHRDCLLPTDDSENVIGAWTITRQLLHDNDTTDTVHIPGAQVSRLGNPLVNELVIGLPDKGSFSRQHPSLDGFFANYVFYPTMPAIVDILFRAALGSTVPLYPNNFPRLDLVTVFLTGFTGFNTPKKAGAGYIGEIMRLNTDIRTNLSNYSPMGVIAGDLAGYPNGRRPGDDIVDISLTVVMGRVCYLVSNVTAFFGFQAQVNCTSANAPVGSVDLTDGAPLNLNYLDNTFPYLRTPYPGSTTDTKPTVCKETTYAYVGASSSHTSGGDGTGSHSGSHSGSTHTSTSSASTLGSFLSFFF